MASNDDILRVLGRLEEGQKRLTDDFQEEKRQAHASRSTIHNRLDDQAKEIASIKTNIAISGQIDAQIRAEVAALRETVTDNHDDVMPDVLYWRRMKTIGIGIAGLIAFAGLTAGTVIVSAGDAAVTAVRHWLRIP